MTTPEISRCKRDSNPGSSALEADALTTRPTRRSRLGEAGFKLVYLRGGSLQIFVCASTLRQKRMGGGGGGGERERNSSLVVCWARSPA